MSVDCSRYFSLNSLGSAIWECLEEPKRLDEIAEFVCTRHEVEMDKARSDIVEFLEILAERKLISAD